MTNHLREETFMAFMDLVTANVLSLKVFFLTMLIKYILSLILMEHETTVHRTFDTALVIILHP